MGLGESLAAFASGLVPLGGVNSGPLIKQGPAFADGQGTGFVDGFFPSQQTVRRGTRELLTSYERSPWVNSNIGKLANDIATLTWRTFVRRDSAGDAVRDINLQHGGLESRAKSLHALLVSGEVEEIPNHPLTALLSMAHTGPDEIEGIPSLDGWATFFVTQAVIDLKDEAFWMIERNAAGRPTDIWVLPPHWVTQLPTAKDPFYKISFGATQTNVPASEVLWFKRPALLNPYGRGSGTGVALGDEIETDEYAAKHNKAFFYNGSTPSMLIGIKGATAATVKEAKQKWDEDNQGFWRRFRTHFYKGELDVQQLTVNPEDAQMNKTRLFERDVIRQVYHIPPELVGIIENSNRATINAAEDIHARGNLLPRAELLRRVIQRRLVPMFDPRLIAHYDSPVPADLERKLKAMRSQPAGPTVDEWRAMQGLPAEEDEDVGKLHLVPANVTAQPLVTEGNDGGSSHEED